MLGKLRKTRQVLSLINPANNTRLGKKLYQVFKVTHDHVKAIPKGSSERELEMRSKAWGAKLVQILGIRVHIDRESTIPDGPKLLISNHRSYADIIVLLSLFPCRFLAKDEVKKWLIIGPAAQSVNTIFVKRDKTSSRWMSREAIEKYLLSGSTITIFPEGTTASPPGCAPFYQGSFEIAAKLGTPIIPIAIEYSPGASWKDESALVNFIRTYRKKNIDVYVAIGDPIYPTLPKQGEEEVTSNEVQSPVAGEKVPEMRESDPDKAEERALIAAEGKRLKEAAREWIEAYLLERWELFNVDEREKQSKNRSKSKFN